MAESLRLEAELAEWRRIEALMEGRPGARYEPETDPVGAAAADQERRLERDAADARVAARRAEQELRDWALRRAEDLKDLAKAGKQRQAKGSNGVGFGRLHIAAWTVNLTGMVGPKGRGTGFPDAFGRTQG